MTKDVAVENSLRLAGEIEHVMEARVSCSLVVNYWVYAVPFFQDFPVFQRSVHIVSRQVRQMLWAAVRTTIPVLVCLSCLFP
jgi:hypothetical protein